MRLEWSLFAQDDRDAIFDDIEADSPQAAITVDERIRGQVKGWMQFPESGRPGRIEGRRELVILRHPRSPLIAHRWRDRADLACVARCPARPSC
ncbi:MAG: type II toxin-antitoxin system RelE/ParE family toxin [Terriglobales bacterium]|jgi:plasmid stabilization system protein ParE